MPLLHTHIVMWNHACRLLIPPTCQVQGSITIAMPTVEWPDTFADISSYFRSLSLDFVNKWGSLDCNLQTNFCQKTLYIMVAFGVFAAGIPLCGWLLTKLVLRHWPRWKGNK